MKTLWFTVLLLTVTNPWFMETSYGKEVHDASMKLYLEGYQLLREQTSFGIFHLSLAYGPMRSKVVIDVTANQREENCKKETIIPAQKACDEDTIFILWSAYTTDWGWIKAGRGLIHQTGSYSQDHSLRIAEIYLRTDDAPLPLYSEFFEIGTRIRNSEFSIQFLEDVTTEFPSTGYFNNRNTQPVGILRGALATDSGKWLGEFGQYDLNHSQFWNLSYSVRADRIDFKFGLGQDLRWTKANLKRQFDGTNYGQFSVTGGYKQLSGSLEFVRRQTQDAFVSQSIATVDYKLLETSSLYLTSVQGFRSTGFVGFRHIL
ncbi:MAG: hypothetical protein HRU19_02125 [Pseudobacteriovorax sp.]|nr:hypothetical protein [Pseudobacteriovorax sp.]